MELGFDAQQEALFAHMRVVGAEVMELAEDARMTALARHQVLGLCLPAEQGGRGCDLVTTARAFEGLGATLDDGGLLLAAGAHLFGVAMTIAKVGTAAQRARFLPKLASGQWLATVAATEAEAGSDVSAVTARIEPDGDDFRARGDKRYVTYADAAALFLFLGRRPGDRGLTVALVEGSDEVRPGARYDTLGLRGARLAPLRFEGARVSAENILGKPGAGMAVFQTAMSYERALVLAFRLGAMGRQLDEAIAFARARRLGGKAIADHQTVRQRIVAMKARLEAARLFTYQAAWALDRGRRAHPEAALAKWWLADAALHNALDALELRGGAGYLASEGLGSNLQDVLGGTIHSGTKDVLAEIIAGWVGL